MGTVLVLTRGNCLLIDQLLITQLFTTMLHVSAMGAEYVEHMRCQIARPETIADLWRISSQPTLGIANVWVQIVDNQSYQNPACYKLEVSTKQRTRARNV